MIRRTRSHKKQVTFVSACGLLLLGFVVAQNLLFAHGSVELTSPSSSGGGLNPAAASQSPTTTPTPAPSPTSTGTPPPIGRDLSQYEDAGSISMGTGAPAERQAALSQARIFLLRKWGERGLGRLSLITTTPTGRPMTGHFYVEQDPTGRWCVTLETEGARPLEVFYFVEEVGVAADGHPILDPTAGGPEPVSRALHLKKSADANSGLVL